MKGTDGSSRKHWQRQVPYSSYIAPFIPRQASVDFPFLLIIVDEYFRCYPLDQSIKFYTKLLVVHVFTFVYTSNIMFTIDYVKLLVVHVFTFVYTSNIMFTIDYVVHVFILICDEHYIDDCT